MAGSLPILESRRFLLRLCGEGDVDHLAALYADPEVMRFYPGLRSREVAEEQVRKFAEHYEKTGYSMWAVEDKASGEFVGRVGLWPLDQTSEVELGYMIGRRRWGEGIATETSAVCLEYGFSKLRLPFIAAITVAGNAASRRVMEKLGFRYVRDDRYYGMDVLYHRVEPTL